MPFVYLQPFFESRHVFVTLQNYLFISFWARLNKQLKTIKSGYTILNML